MKRLKLNRITLKLVAVFVIMLFVSHALMLLVTNLLVRDDLLRQGRFENRSEVQAIAAFVGKALADGWSEEAMRSALTLNLGRAPRLLYVYDRTGNRVLVAEGRPGLTFEPDPEFFREVIGQEGIERSRPILTERAGTKWFVSAAPVPALRPDAGGADAGPAVGRSIEVVSVSPAIKPDFTRWNRSLLVSACITLLLGLVLALVTSGLVTRRLKRMIEGARQIAKGNFRQPIPVGSQDELGQLAETLNRMAEELGSLDKMRKDFLANVSHDLRSPLTSIHGYAGALMDGTIPKEQSPHYLAIIGGQTKRLIRLVNDLLDMAKVEAGQFAVDPAPFNLTETIRRALARMEPQFTQHRVVFRIYTDDDGEEVYALGDADRIEQVLLNLVQNAVEFSAPGEQIDVALRRPRGSERVFVDVADKGIGMDEQELEKIWDRFYKSDEARSRKNGTGIGLSIVKAILDRHEAEIEVRSEKGEGTTFSFTLPVAAAPRGRGGRTSSDSI